MVSFQGPACDNLTLKRVAVLSDLRLRAAGSGIDDEGLTYLEDCPRLAYLDFTGCAIGDSGSGSPGSPAERSRAMARKRTSLDAAWEVCETPVG